MKIITLRIGEEEKLQTDLVFLLKVEYSRYMSMNTNPAEIYNFLEIKKFNNLIKTK